MERQLIHTDENSACQDREKSIVTEKLFFSEGKVVVGALRLSHRQVRLRPCSQLQSRILKDFC